MAIAKSAQALLITKQMSPQLQFDAGSDSSKLSLHEKNVNIAIAGQGAFVQFGCLGWRPKRAWSHLGGDRSHTPESSLLEWIANRNQQNLQTQPKSREGVTPLRVPIRECPSSTLRSPSTECRKNVTLWARVRLHKRKLFTFMGGSYKCFKFWETFQASINSHPYLAHMKELSCLPNTLNTSEKQLWLIILSWQIIIQWWSPISNHCTIMR